MKYYKVIAKETFNWYSDTNKKNVKCGIKKGNTYLVREDQFDDKDFWDVFDPIYFRWEIQIFRHRFTSPVNESKGPILK